MANDNGITVVAAPAKRSFVPASDEVRGQEIRDLLVLVSDTSGCTIKLRYGRKPNKDGTGFTITYVTVKAPGKPKTEDEALASLFRAAKAKLKIPTESESDLHVTLSPEMSGERAAVALSILTGRTEIPGVEQTKFEAVLAAIKASK